MMYNILWRKERRKNMKTSTLTITAMLFISIGVSSAVKASGCVQVTCQCAQTKICIATKDVNSQMYAFENPGKVCDDRCRRAFPGWLEVSCKATCTKYE